MTEKEFTPTPLSQEEKDLAFRVKAFSASEHRMPHREKGWVPLYNEERTNKLLNNDRIPAK